MGDAMAEEVGMELELEEEESGGEEGWLSRLELILLESRLDEELEYEVDLE